MDLAYQYRDPDRLYLNVTNRCTNRCSFCVRARTARLGDGMLIGDSEPDLDELLTAVESKGGSKRFAEIVWCGYGEPTFRLDLILEASPVLRAGGAKIRLNTNGHACLIHGRDVLPELGEVVDRVNVSLNAPSAEHYIALCRPDPRTIPLTAAFPPDEAFWDATLEFLSRAPDHIDEVQASVVGHTLHDREIQQCRDLAADLAGVTCRIR